MVYHEKALHNKYIFVQSQTKVVMETSGSRMLHLSQSVMENAAFISTKRDKIPEFQHCDGERGQLAWYPNFFIWVCSLIFLPSPFFPALTLQCNRTPGSRLVCTILAKS